MYPTRLHIRDNSWVAKRYQLYAYPEHRPKDTIVQLQTRIPALISFVLGPNFTWCEEGNERQSLTVPQINWTNEDEAAIALRILRAGGAIHDISWIHERWWMCESRSDMWLRAEQQKKYIFAWPESGGVWVLHLSPLLEEHFDCGRITEAGIEQMLMEEAGELDDAVFRDTDGSVRYGDLMRVETMSELCRKLKEHGAVWYECIGDSPEVHDLGLTDIKAALRQKVIET
jgi:hypothetical protein